ncbi:MAG: hypothetical protein AAF645_20355 [Myxococcota bacterium]
MLESLLADPAFNDAIRGFFMRAEVTQNTNRLHVRATPTGDEALALAVEAIRVFVVRATMYHASGYQPGR